MKAKKTRHHKAALCVIGIFFTLVACNSGRTPTGSAPISLIQDSSSKNESSKKQDSEQEAPNVTPKSCSNDADCMSNQICMIDIHECVGSPLGECESDQDCTMGEICDPESHQCSPATPPTGSNGIRDGDESDIDCGGSAPAKCATGKMCKVDNDCVSGNQCQNGLCVAVTPPSQDSNGVKDGDESDIDCGGSNPNKCALGKTCESAADCDLDAECENHICTLPVFGTCPNGTCAAPTCKTTSPVDGTEQWSTSVSGTSAIKAVFDQPMDKNTINNQTFYIQKTEDGSLIKGVIMLLGNSDVALFWQNKGLDPNTHYTATVTTGAKSKTGVALAQECKWSFTTGNAVKSISPGKDADNVSTVVGKIKIEFKDNIPPNSFTKNSLVLTPPVPIESVKQDDYSVTFIISQKGDFETDENKQLKDNMTYTAHLKKENVLGSDYYWNFSTANCPDPELTLTWLIRWCNWNIANCQGAGCDPGFKQGDKVVTSGLYMMQWQTKHVDYVIEDCHSYESPKLNFDSAFGVLSWNWDGPTTDKYSPYFTSAWNRFFNGLINLFEIQEAYAAGGNTTYTARHAGKFTCTATAYGACLKKKNVIYHYQCPM